MRVDPTTFEATQLGTIRFDAKPPFRGMVTSGDAALRDIVKEMNALDHVMSAGVAGRPQRVERTDDQFLRIMQLGWLADTHHVELHLPGKAGAPVRRYDVVTLDAGKNVLLGTVAINDVHYLAIVDGPAEQRERLWKVVKEVNGRTVESVDVPHPNGKSRKWGRVVERGTSAFLPMLRDRLYREGALLIPEGRKRPDELHVQGPFARTGVTRWLSAEVPGGFIVVPPADDVVFHLAGPPGGALGFRVLRYDEVSPEPSALKEYVRKLHGKAPAFTEGDVGEVEIASRKLLALPFRTGEGHARSAHLIALWPDIEPSSTGDKPRHEGVAIELTTGGQDEKPSIEAAMKNDRIVTVVDSLFIDLDAAP
ncbi:MAG: hypothetical protein HOW73_15995 [Polyangiaceae bacterium]|nr:hypothetical protein [Polyangiaceae bacterium]